MLVPVAIVVVAFLSVAIEIVQFWNNLQYTTRVIIPVEEGDYPVVFINEHMHLLQGICLLFFLNDLFLVIKHDQFDADQNEKLCDCQFWSVGFWTFDEFVLWLVCRF